MPKAAHNVKELFLAEQRPMILAEIRKSIPSLQPNEISMALSHYTKSRNLTFEVIPNPSNKGRKTVKRYTWHKEKIANENHEQEN